MPVMSTLAAASARAFGLTGSAETLFKASKSVVFVVGANTVTLPAATSVGDLLVFFVTDVSTGMTGISGAGATWSTPTVTTGGILRYTYGVCGALSDITVTIAVGDTDECGQLLVIRNSPVLTFQGETSGSAGTVRTAPGFTKDAASKLILTAGVTSIAAGHQACTTPGFTTLTGPTNARSQDCAYVQSNVYVNGSGIDWTGVDGQLSSVSSFEVT